MLVSPRDIASPLARVQSGTPIQAPCPIEPKLEFTGTYRSPNISVLLVPSLISFIVTLLFCPKMPPKLCEAQ